MAELLVTLGMSATAASTVATVATIAGPVLSTLGAVQQMQEGKAQAAEFSRQAREERVAAGIRAERMRRQARLQQSAERTAMAEGGALSGTAIGVLDQNAVAQEMDALTVSFQGEQAGASADFRSQQARRSASPLNVFSTAVQSFGQMDPLNLNGQV
jgi:hypothetical protein